MKELQRIPRREEGAGIYSKSKNRHRNASPQPPVEDRGKGQRQHDGQQGHLEEPNLNARRYWKGGPQRGSLRIQNGSHRVKLTDEWKRRERATIKLREPR